MSRQLPLCMPAQVIRALERAGWQYRNATGSHRRYKHPTRPGTVIVPFHRRDLKRGTLHGILKDAGLTTGEFIKLFRG
jgi:predicted RNA binding protein YcfA (HicA-like mRNA interferase family)